MGILNLPKVQWLEANGDSITSVWRNGERLWKYYTPPAFSTEPSIAWSGTYNNNWTVTLGSIADADTSGYEVTLGGVSVGLTGTLTEADQGKYLRVYQWGNSTPYLVEREVMVQVVYTYPVIDLEASLTLTNSFAIGSTNWINDISRNSRGIFALDITGMTATEGIIWEAGGSGNGGAVYVKDGKLVIRAGNGGADIPASNCSHLSVDCPTGDGILVMAIEYGSGYSGEVKLWWNGYPLTGTSQNGMNGVNVWSGTNAAAYLSSSTNVPVGVPTTAFTGYSTISSLRYYQDQVIS